jgi:hypothetical protein
MDKITDYYKEQYFFELTRKDQIYGRLPIPIGFLTIIFSGYVYFIVNINALIEHYSLWCFLIIILVSLYFAIKASYSLYKTLSGFEHAYTPSPEKLKKYEKEFDGNGDLEALFFEGIKGSYIKATTINRKGNNLRTNYLHKTNINTIFAMLFLILSAIPFFIGNNTIEYKKDIEKTTKTSYYVQK